MGMKIEGRNQAIQKVAESLREVEGNILIVNDSSQALHFLKGERWDRFSIGKKDGRILPEGKFKNIVLRIDVSKQVTNHLARCCNAVASEQAKIWLVGGNDEGIKSIASTLNGVTSDFETIAIKKRFRLILSKPTHNIMEQIPLEKTTINLLEQQMEWTISPSAFAKGTLDQGTALLLEYIQNFPRKRALQLVDFASGTGVLAWGLKHVYPDAHIDGIEADSWAMAAAKKNVRGIHWLLSDGWTKMPRDRRYDLIVSNPPVHFGKETDYSILEGLFRGAKDRLHRRGEIWLVLQSHISLTKLLPQSRAEVLEESAGYRIWKVLP